MSFVQSETTQHSAVQSFASRGCSKEALTCLMKEVVKEIMANWKRQERTASKVMKWSVSFVEPAFLLELIKSGRNLITETKLDLDLEVISQMSVPTSVQRGWRHTCNLKSPKNIKGSFWNFKLSHYTQWLPIHHETAVGFRKTSGVRVPCQVWKTFCVQCWEARIRPWGPEGDRLKLRRT